jgi:hypothetical protein
MKVTRCAVGDRTGSFTSILHIDFAHRFCPAPAWTYDARGLPLPAVCCPEDAMKAHRPTIMGTRHMVAACQYLAAEAGFAFSNPEATRSTPGSRLAQVLRATCRDAARLHRPPLPSPLPTSGIEYNPENDKQGKGLDFKDFSKWCEVREKIESPIRRC